MGTPDEAQVEAATLPACALVVSARQFRAVVTPGPVWTWDGFLEADERVVWDLLHKGSVWFPRTKGPGGLEEDPFWKQVIPYVLLRRGREWFWYDRPAKGGDPRLRRRRSLGLGGHCEPQDAGLPGWPSSPGLSDPMAALRACALRELEEEARVPEGRVERLKFRGLVNDDGDDVGRVHLGFVFEATVACEPVPGPEVAGWGWSGPPDLPLADAIARAPEWESWSRFLVPRLRDWTFEGAPPSSEGFARVAPPLPEGGRHAPGA